MARRFQRRSFKNFASPSRRRGRVRSRRRAPARRRSAPRVQTVRIVVEQIGATSAPLGQKVAAPIRGARFP